MSPHFFFPIMPIRHNSPGQAKRFSSDFGDRTIGPLSDLLIGVAYARFVLRGLTNFEYLYDPNTVFNR